MRKKLARKGQDYLQEAVLDVLYNVCRQGSKAVGLAEISETAGIYRKAGAAGMNDAIVQGILNLLSDQRKVNRREQENKKGGWRLTDEEYKRRVEQNDDDTEID